MFPTCSTHLTRASTVPALAHPNGHVDCPLLVCSFTSLVLIGISNTLHVILCLSSPVLTFPELQATFPSHWATYGATAIDTRSSFTNRSSPAFCPYILSRFEQGLTVAFHPFSRNWSPRQVT